MLLNLEHSFDFHGQSVAWGAMGEGDPIIMIHGFPWSAQSWRKIVPWLAKRNCVYYYDMVGCGESEKHELQDVSAGVQNELLAALIAHWNLDCPQVIAHDFGGLAALRGYYLNQLRYRALTLIDVVAVTPSGSPFYRHVSEHEMAFSGLPEYAHRALFSAYIQNAAHNKLNRQVIDMYALPWTGDTGQPAFYRQIAQSDQIYIEEVQNLYSAMDCTVNIIWASNDTFIPLNQGEQLASLICADSFVKIPNAGHLIQEDAADVVLGNLLTM